ncbi:heme o synthase [Tenuibacillus multivorans]|uniref:Protoheme IX farnesyltransferase n=1 Tax=Tenuibacillus multivorans TaxID=237069 RepID=A0A1G9YAD2_9BACI|nr:heme o synthase [Tenuibacillus multivorans]GEL76013.1 protoheme IX farnesyltransferase 2 [Tenuibacillus multivorans]SDN06017.1 protoheme IX farnesyltransferase [Tenuibacillus multivorans]
MSEPRSIHSTLSDLDDRSTNIKALWTDFLALIKIGIINSNLITTFAGFWLALYFTNQEFLSNWVTFLLVMLGTGLVIAGGCVINNWYDRDIDQVMSRTKNRPTITGTISLNVILALGFGFTVLGLLLLYLTTPIAALIAFIGWFAYVVMYTIWSKRRYTINTVIGSFSGAAPPLIGWAAVDQTLHPVAFVLFLVMFIWQTPHFLSLAIRKRKEYSEAGIPMLPVLYGNNITKRQILIYTICLLPLPFYFFSLGPIFVVFATLLNLGWLAIAFYGFKMKDDDKWAKWMFIYSLNYLTFFFVGLVLATIPAMI